MKSRLPAVLIAITVGALVAVGVPFGELWYKCQQPTSEQCVWAKSLLSLSLSVGVVLGLGAALFAYVVARAVQRRRAGRQDAV